MYTAIGWRPYLAVFQPAFVELTREFYSIFEFELPTRYTVETPNVIRFRLMGKEFNFSITQFNLAFGFITREYAVTREYAESACDYVEPFLSPYHDVWWDIFVDRQRYDPSRSRSSFLEDPSVRYVQRLLAYSYSGRKDSSSIISRPKLFFLWCMKTGFKVNLGCWLTAQFKTVLAKKNIPLILESYITRLAVQLGVLILQDHDLHLACDMEFVNVERLERMGVLEHVNGAYRFTPSGPPSASPHSSFTNSAPAGDDAGSSTSALPPPPPGAAEWNQLRIQVQNLEARMINIDHNVHYMAQNLAAFMQHAGHTSQFGYRPPL